MNIIDPLALSYLCFGLACFLTGIYIIRKTGRDRLRAVAQVKKLKENMLENFLSEISILEEANKKLLSQKELLDAYDNETIKEALDLVNKIQTEISMLGVLDDKSILQKINFYLTGEFNMLKSLLEIEHESMEFQKEYQQKVTVYNNEYEKLSETVTDPEMVKTYKKKVIKDLDLIKQNVVIALRNIKYKREEYYNELTYSQKLIEELKSAVAQYIEKKVHAKKFYLQYLTFL